MPARKRDRSAGEDGALDASGSKRPKTARKGCSAKMSTMTSATEVQAYRDRLKAQGKYEDCKPGTRSTDGCLHDPPRLPPSVEVLKTRAPLPKRAQDGTLTFPDWPSFTPNLTPAEVLQLGSFGGTYFRDIQSAVTGEKHIGKTVVKEFPQEWFKGLDIGTQVCSQVYTKKVNAYGVSCGGSLGQWETSGWISQLDPYGWFQWYCRFYLGRRSTDDERQIDRWTKGQAARSGRWRTRLCNDIIKAKAKCGDVHVSPVVRQVLQHWAYRLTPAALEAHRKAKGK